MRKGNYLSFQSHHSLILLSGLAQTLPSGEKASLWYPPEKRTPIPCHLLQPLVSVGCLGRAGDLAWKATQEALADPPLGKAVWARGISAWWSRAAPGQVSNTCSLPRIPGADLSPGASREEPCCSTSTREPLLAPPKCLLRALTATPGFCEGCPARGRAVPAPVGVILEPEQGSGHRHADAAPSTLHCIV